MAENASPPQSNEPLSPEELRNSSAKFVALALKEWLPSLLDQPTKPPFRYDAPFKNESWPVARLLTTVVVILFFVLAGLRLLNLKFAVVDVISTAFYALIISFVIGLFYNIFAHLFRVKLCPPVVLADGKQKKFASQWQILFAVLYTFIPWLPVFTFLLLATWSLQVTGTLHSLAVLSLFVCVSYALYNYVKAMREISNCPSYRIWFSTLVPIILVMLFSLFRFFL